MPRIRLSTTMLLIVIAALSFALWIQGREARRREERLVTELRWSEASREWSQGPEWKGKEGWDGARVTQIPHLVSPLPERGEGPKAVR